MYKLSNRANADVDAILDYSISHFGKGVMVKYAQSLEKCFEMLAETPYLGMEVEHIRLDYLCFEHHSHLIFYKKIDQNILIIRILHKSIDAPKHF